MGSNRTTFEKQQRDRAKKAKAAAKRDRRQGRADEPIPHQSADPRPAPGVPASVSSLKGDVTAEQLLALVESLHQRFENEEISFDEFEEEKAQLFALLNVD
jgi:hypothetical protein